MALSLALAPVGGSCLSLIQAQYLPVSDTKKAQPTIDKTNNKAE